MADITLNLNEQISVTATFSDAYGVARHADSVVWASSAPNIVIVNAVTFVPGSNNSISTNVVTAVGVGDAIVSVTVDGSLTNNFNIIVIDPQPTVINFIFSQPILP